jgi:predicted nucleic acid-binding protein
VIVIDTNIAIDLRDLDRPTQQRVAGLPDLPMISMFTWIELEGGVAREPDDAGPRRQRLDRMLRDIAIIDVTPDDIVTYGRIVRDLGYSRTKVFDRLIAAQCLTRRAALVTRNAADFRDIQGLELVAW